MKKSNNLENEGALTCATFQISLEQCRLSADNRDALIDQGTGVDNYFTLLKQF